MSVIAELQDTVWTLEEGLAVVRTLQPVARSYGYHVALGGGVLNRGYSKKDLDIYFLPLESGPSHAERLAVWLQDFFGDKHPSFIGYGPSLFTYKLTFNSDHKRIDVFIA
jgi:hypothetical protein